MWFEQFYSAIVWDAGREYRRGYCTTARVELSKRDHRLTRNQYVISDLNSICE
ncbi:unnamed protein product [Heligmosomoides polygyrus]|uniref:Transposase n=1 Tax=Heligmosomoides polygyrus TaxID=6339 RepID=A0A183FMK6_HELPZ|nr:unnamed protein product [Heligmosomoides polygyrus]